MGSSSCFDLSLHLQCFLAQNPHPQRQPKSHSSLEVCSSVSLSNSPLTNSFTSAVKICISCGINLPNQMKWLVSSQMHLTYIACPRVGRKQQMSTFLTCNPDQLTSARDNLLKAAFLKRGQNDPPVLLNLGVF